VAQWAYRSGELFLFTIGLLATSHGVSARRGAATLKHGALKSEMLPKTGSRTDVGSMLDAFASSASVSASEW